MLSDRISLEQQKFITFQDMSQDSVQKPMLLKIVTVTAAEVVEFVVVVVIVMWIAGTASN